MSLDLTEIKTTFDKVMARLAKAEADAAHFRQLAGDLTEQLAAGGQALYRSELSDQEQRRIDSMEAASLQTVLMKLRKDARPEYPAGLFEWARKVIVADAVSLNEARTSLVNLRQAAEELRNAMDSGEGVDEAIEKVVSHEPDAELWLLRDASKATHRYEFIQKGGAQ